MTEITFTDEQWYALCDAGAGHPVPLHEADLTRPFVYDRRYGVFYVESGYHQIAMATLCAFAGGVTSHFDLPTRGSLSYWADHFMISMDGVAMLSSVGRSIFIGDATILTASERTIFARHEYRRFSLDT